MLDFPKTSYRRDSLGYCSVANKLFLTFVVSDHASRIQFLKNVGIIRSKVQCNSCGRDITCYEDPSLDHIIYSRWFPLAISKDGGLN